MEVGGLSEGGKDLVGRLIIDEVRHLTNTGFFKISKLNCPKTQMFQAKSFGPHAGSL